MESSMQPSVRADLSYEVLAPFDVELHPIDKMLISLRLKTDLRLTLRNSVTGELLAVDIANLEIDFDRDKVAFAISGDLVTGRRVNGYIFTRPTGVNHDVIGMIQLAL